ncbi:MAG: alginate O-acetyltransferase AlgX-related protein [Bacteroidia bacterium]
MKQRIFLLFLILLFIPLIQQLFSIIPDKPLDGINPADDLPAFSIRSWLNGDYQKNYDLCYEKKVGFHNTLVRLHNQINYTVFDMSDAGDNVIGKKGYLYLKPYIYAYTGADFVGTECIDIQSQKIKVIQEELKKRNISFFISFAPGKGSFYPEYIPDAYKSNMHPGSTNYAYYKKMFFNYKINFLDLESFFLKIKGTEKYPLYSTTGVHWTQYGCYLAGAKMVKYIESLRNIKLPAVKLKSAELVSFAGNKSNDYDAATLMNTFTAFPHSKVAVPELLYQSDSKTVKPHFLCITDSYFPGIAKVGIPRNVFTDYHYWLYYDRVFPESFVYRKECDKKHLKKELEKNDVICIMVTDASLTEFPFGFVDDVYELYAKKDSAYYQLKIKYFKWFINQFWININNNKEWKSEMTKKAKAEKISEAQEFFNNAMWLYNQQQEHYKTISY